MKNRRLVVLDLSGMVAGSKYRGEFEERIKKVIAEVMEHPGILLFIDELHTIIGAGGAEGALDASNILKPSLSRGEIQIIGATTIEEYRKHIEKDAALERRFQPVTVEEPTEEQAVEILKGLRPYYEKHHGVTITDDALEAAVKMSIRYIADRHLPDKAIDLMDEASSRVQLAGIAVPPQLKEMEQNLHVISGEKEEAIREGDFSRARELQEEQKELDIVMPEVGEYDKEEILAFEKEVLGVYISGHPLEQYVGLLERNITNRTTDFVTADGEMAPKVRDQAPAVIGGMITAKTVKTTRTNSLMAFITLEDLYGTVEVIVFPRDYDKNRSVIEEDRKVLIKGRVTVEEDKPAKLICSEILPFDELDKDLWIQFETRADYEREEQFVLDTVRRYDGRDMVHIYLHKERAHKLLPRSYATRAEGELLEILRDRLGADNVKVVEKSIEK